MIFRRENLVPKQKIFLQVHKYHLSDSNKKRSHKSIWDNLVFLQPFFPLQNSSMNQQCNYSNSNNQRSEARTKYENKRV